jgi:hypothetical protein
MAAGASQQRQSYRQNIAQPPAILITHSGLVGKPLQRVALTHLASGAVRYMVQEHWGATNLRGASPGWRVNTDSGLRRSATRHEGTRHSFAWGLNRPQAARCAGRKMADSANGSLNTDAAFDTYTLYRVRYRVIARRCGHLSGG